jgi:hypothetical protein
MSFFLHRELESGPAGAAGPMKEADSWKSILPRARGGPEACTRTQDFRKRCCTTGCSRPHAPLATSYACWPVAHGRRINSRGSNHRWM